MVLVCIYSLLSRYAARCYNNELFIVKGRFHFDVNFNEYRSLSGQHNDVLFKLYTVADPEGGGQGAMPPPKPLAIFLILRISH